MKKPLVNLLQFNGGFLANANKESISIGRFKNGNVSQESVFSDTYDKYIPKDGDKITSALYDTYVANRVSISGAVKVPGSFNILNANTAYDLINLSEGLREDALKDLALLYRKENGVEKLIEGIPLSKIITQEINYPLKEGDRLEVLSVKETVQDKFVSILGAVKSPNKYKFYQGMTPLDLIYLAGGQNVNVNPVVSIYRQSTNNNSGLESLEIDITGDLNLLPKLNENDVVVVREKKYETLNTVLINGPVKNPGVYGLRTNMNLESLIEEAGGLLDFANKDGIFIKRVLDQKVLETIKEKVAKDSIGIDQELLNKNYLEVSVDIKKAGNIFLKKGDVINILKKTIVSPFKVL
jgi:protein involved in polysaccharide export with SLBB domain